MTSCELASAAEWRARFVAELKALNAAAHEESAVEAVRAHFTARRPQRQEQARAPFASARAVQIVPSLARCLEQLGAAISDAMISGAAGRGTTAVNFIAGPSLAADIVLQPMCWGRAEALCKTE